MSDENTLPDEVTILAADHSLLRKLGGVSLDKVLSPGAIKEAEAAIAEASGGLYSDCVAEGAKLQGLAAQLGSGKGDAVSILKNLVAVSFAAKTKAGLSGFDLVAALAKSLQILCEKTDAGDLAPATIQIIEWHVKSINQILSLKIKGDGGEAGKAVLAEIEKINR